MEDILAALKTCPNTHSNYFFFSEKKQNKQTQNFSTTLIPLKNMLTAVVEGGGLRSDKTKDS